MGGSGCLKAEIDLLTLSALLLLASSSSLHHVTHEMQCSQAEKVTQKFEVVVQEPSESYVIFPNAEHQDLRDL